MIASSFHNSSSCKFILKILISCCIPGTGDITVNRNDKNTCHQGGDILIDDLMKAKDLCLRKMRNVQNAALF